MGRSAQTMAHSTNAQNKTFQEKLINLDAVITRTRSLNYQLFVYVYLLLIQIFG